MNPELSISLSSSHSEHLESSTNLQNFSFLPFFHAFNHTNNQQLLQELPFFYHHISSESYSFTQSVSLISQSRVSEDINEGFIQIPVTRRLGDFQQIHTGRIELPISDPESLNITRQEDLSHSSQDQPQSQSPPSSSLPDLVPITDWEDNVPDLFPVLNTFDINTINSRLDTSSTVFRSPPPEYFLSEEALPRYQQPWGREIVLRRIRILQTEATELYRRIDQIRSDNILLYNEAINTQLRDHDVRYQNNIDHLEDLLDLWN